MKVTVLRPFPYSLDGIHALVADPGEVVDMVDDLVPGLMAEGFVDQVPDLGSPVAEPQIDQPDVPRPSKKGRR